MNVASLTLLDEHSELPIRSVVSLARAAQSRWRHPLMTTPTAAAAAAAAIEAAVKQGCCACSNADKRVKNTPEASSRRVYYSVPYANENHHEQDWNEQYTQ